MNTELVIVEEVTRRAARESPLLGLRCSVCAYGVSCRTAPERCPMCGASSWEHEEWRPFSQIAADDLVADLAMLRELPV